jgi:hypothetical protein
MVHNQLQSDKAIDGPSAELGVSKACIPEHCYHAFDALYCALTDADPISPSFPDGK